MGSCSVPLLNGKILKEHTTSIPNPITQNTYYDGQNIAQDTEQSMPMNLAYSEPYPKPHNSISTAHHEMLDYNNSSGLDVANYWT